MLQHEILDAIIKELARIGRRVEMTELDYVPFANEVRRSILQIYLHNSGRLMVSTLLEDGEDELLDTMISFNEIGHSDLIDLLELLMTVESEPKK